MYGATGPGADALLPEAAPASDAESDAEGAASDEPLLESGLSLRKATIHMVKGNIGPGCLSFAHAASQAGLVPSLVMLAIIVAVCQSWIGLAYRAWTNAGSIDNWEPAPGQGRCCGDG